MTTPNHLAGGLVITGLAASFYEINIFSEASYLIIIFVGSLLPDVDHTKSIIGKALWPVSKAISQKYAHRTITHSLLFLFSSTLIFWFINNYFLNIPAAATILFFSVFSHYLLDMITIQGIPLFYPFVKNPCVIPGKLEWRLSSGNLKQEGIAFFMFGLLLFTMQDLFAVGFWSKLNSKFEDTKHVYREFNSSNNLYEADYVYSNFQQKYCGKAIIIDASENQTICYQKGSIFTITRNQNGMFIQKLVSRKLKITKKVNHNTFENISIDSLNSLCQDKIILGMKVTSKNKIALKQTVATNFKLNNVYSPIFQKVSDSSITINQIKSELIKNIQLEEQELAEQNKIYYKLIGDIKTTESELIKQKDIYQEQILEEKLIKLQQDLAKTEIKKPSKTLQLLEHKLNLLQKQKTEKNTITGTITQLILPKNLQ